MVHVLATCRRQDLSDYTQLVFKTIRVGFPTASIAVHLNRLTRSDPSGIYNLADGIAAKITETNTIHHEWIESLLNSEQEPFWILDTDVIFYGSFEEYKFDGPLAGCRIPEWRDEFSGCITRARLHTSLLYIDPVKVRAAIAKYNAAIADTPFTPKVNLVHPLVVPFKSQPYFYDTCSLLYHAVGGTPFTDQQKDRYAHMNFGTIADIVMPRLKDAPMMQARRQQILDDTQSGRGIWRAQQEYYECKQP